MNGSKSWSNSGKVLEGLQFCKDKGYCAIQHVTSECHDAAWELYLKEDFDLKEMYHKSIVELQWQYRCMASSA